MKTFMPKASDIARKWYVVDAEGQVLGRLASQVANILRGKTKPIYTPNMDTGDYVIIINADKVVMTGKKLDQKIYYHHSGYVGGLKETKYRLIIVLLAAVRRPWPASAWLPAMAKSSSTSVTLTATLVWRP